MNRRSSSTASSFSRVFIACTAACLVSFVLPTFLPRDRGDAHAAGICGDGNVDTDEACDDGNALNGDGCDNNCTETRCGNRVVTGNEECDDGNSVEGDSCDSNCTLPRCGNGIADGDEECDDGNVGSGDGCDANCTPTACGNGIASAGEECDDGNGVDGDLCDNDCTHPRCGDGHVDPAEQCDPPEIFVCSPNCTFAERCTNGFDDNGNGLVDCEDPECGFSTACQSIPTCGNGVIDADKGETCDPPDVPAGVICGGNCTYCGDGNIDFEESCDDGNTVQGCDPAQPQKPLDPCNNDCKSPICEDPGTIVVRPDALDVINVEGKISPIHPVVVDPSGERLAFELTTSRGSIFHVSVGPRDLKGTANGEKALYVNRAAKESGGVRRVSIRRTAAGIYRVRIEAYGDLSAATEHMRTHISIGNEAYEVDGVWRARRTGWRFDQSATYGGH